MLITDLSNVKSIQIVEREKLESLLKEIELGEGKFIDPNTAQKLGKGLGGRLYAYRKLPDHGRDHAH